MEPLRVYTLDWFNHKYIGVALPEWEPLPALGEYFVYKQDNGKESIGMSTGTVPHFAYERSGLFVSHIRGEDRTHFDNDQRRARTIYPLFKKDFKAYLPDVTPVTAKFNPLENKYFFYFYAEKRYNFSDFVKTFRSKLDAWFFIYQISAREMMKISPATDELHGCVKGQWLCCKRHRPFPLIDIQEIYEQHLVISDIEKLKGRCGKFKCSLIFEIDDYMAENKKTPAKWSTINNLCNTCGIVTNINIQTRKVHVKTDWWPVVLDLDLLQEAYAQQQTKKHAFH